jgi:two-component system, OmpR family, phosphate regulon response regulator PhoB
VSVRQPPVDEAPAVDVVARRWALVVDDDALDRAFLSETLKREGFVSIECANGAAALDFVRSRPVDVVLLDLGLGQESGLEVLVEIRRHSDVPVIISTGQADVETAVVGLRLGADDHLVKPYPAALLAARVAAILRRARTHGCGSRLEFGDLAVDSASRDVTVAGRRIAMPAREFDLLAFLAANPRRVFSRSQLLREVWGSSAEWQDESTVTEHVRRLRGRIESDAPGHRWITTVRRAGYRFDP